MSRNNIDCFHEATLRILSALYDTFPIPADINIQDLIQNMDHFSHIPSLRSVFFETINFLANEGFIRHSTRSERGGLVFLEVVMTSKTLIRLNLAPANIQRTLIEEIRNALKTNPPNETSRTMINRCAAQLLKERH